MAENFDLVVLTGMRPETGIHFEVRPIGSNFQIFPVFRCGTLCLWTRKSTFRIFFPFWTPHGRKFRFVFLTGMQPELEIGHFEVRSTGWNFQIFPLKRVIRSGTMRLWSRKFPSRIFYAIWPPHSRKFRFDLFDRLATVAWDWSFWGMTKGQICNFSPGESIWLRNLTPMVQKVSL